jgi:hypothetical protein
MPSQATAMAVFLHLPELRPRSLLKIISFIP